ncbi:hypothetical protein [Cohnella candidum]|uniref:alpha/beta hydrolase n=1 Tax=Cohnella candidum TaxID=2674991 RepID=UPI00240544D0|nr:hypothetical protein [Cohnella candidum]
MCGWLRRTRAKGCHWSDRQKNFPIVIFSHGGGTSMEIHTAQCEDLASQGYIVAAINHTYVSSATELPSGIVTDREATVKLRG